MRRLLKRKFKLFKGQGGISLLENLIAASLLATVGVVFMMSMSTSYKSVGIVDEQQMAETLARSQLEDIKNSPYSDNRSYPVTVNLPPQYSISMTVTPPMHIGTTDNNTPLEELMGYPITTIQEITVSVYRGSKLVLSVACYKVK